MLFYKQPPLPTDKKDSISIIISFRNEAQNLLSFLKSLAAQEYTGTYEIILVNDQSTDNYLEAIDKFKNTSPQAILKLTTSCYNDKINLTSKQQALDFGVKHSSYDWIAFTDADTVLEKNWLSSLIHSTANSFSIVYGHTIVKKSPSHLFQALQAFQLEFLFTTAYAFHVAGLRGSCMGNNMLISKEVYNKIGGQQGIGYSIVEDRDLLNAAMKKGYSTSVSVPFTPTAQTSPCKSIQQFFYQILRWIKGGSKKSFSLLPAMALFGAQNCIVLLAVLSLVPDVLLWSSIANIILLGIFLYTGFKKTGSKENILFFPVFYIFFILETLIMIVPALFMSPVWKQRKI
jgi:cellulose synthase/poly-beta-1,6-N-acetylglucosamine synthase-like glycosyltransferase